MKMDILVAGQPAIVFGLVGIQVVARCTTWRFLPRRWDQPRTFGTQVKTGTIEVICVPASSPGGA
jgi:hypothetical protein